MRQTLQLLSYLAAQEDALLTYHANDMVLAVHSNASYVSEPKEQSRVRGHFFLLPFKEYNCPAKQLGSTEHSTYH
jgi:hypothetical protein